MSVPLNVEMSLGEMRNLQHQASTNYETREMNEYCRLSINANHFNRPESFPVSGKSKTSIVPV